MSLGPGKMLSTGKFFDFLSQMSRDFSHGDSQVGEVLWAFTMAEVLNIETPEL